MDLFTAIEGRRSAGRLGEPGPDAAQLERILRAAASAPDHGRLSPWRFVVMEGAARGVLGDAMASLLLRKHPDATPEALQTERAKALRAPLVIAVAARTVAAHKVPEVEQVAAVAAGAQNLLLAARALGFGSMWKTGAPAYDAGVKTALGLEPSDAIVGFVYLGTTLAPGKPREITLDGAVRRL